MTLYGVFDHLDGMKKNIFILCLSAFLFACQTAPKRYQAIMEGEWQAKVLIKDLVKSQSHILNIDIKAIQNQSLRMDVTTPAGIHVASLVLNNDDIQYVLMQDKKFIRGKASPSALKPLIQIPLDPKILQNIVFDIPIDSDHWECKLDKNDFISECDNKNEKLKITWKDRDLTTKLVKVTHPKAELQMKFLNFQTHISKREKAFELKIPPNFRLYRLR